MQFTDKPLIIAHRGASAYAPENTFAAFRQAIEAAADGIEFDVHLTKDEIPVVIHDAKLERLANVKNSVANLTAAELQKLDVGSWFNRKNPQFADAVFAAEIVPALVELFDFLADFRGVIYVELKGDDAEIAPLAEKVCRLIKQTKLLPNIIVKSFNLEGIAAVKKLLPEVRTAALFEPKILTILRRKKMILEEAKKFNADEISIHRSMATEKFVRRAAAENLPVTIWTADNPLWVRRALNFGINAIITNDPARLLAERDKILRIIQ